MRKTVHVRRREAGLAAALKAIAIVFAVGMLAVVAAQSGYPF